MRTRRTFLGSLLAAMAGTVLARTPLAGASLETLEPMRHEWTGAVSSDWQDPRNWNTGMVPRACDHVLIEFGHVDLPKTGKTIAASIDIDPSEGGGGIWISGFPSPSDSIRLLPDYRDSLIYVSP